MNNCNIKFEVYGMADDGNTDNSDIYLFFSNTPFPRIFRFIGLKILGSHENVAEF